MSSIQGQNKGNKSAMKFKTPEERKAMCIAFCKHISEGLSKESFPLCDPQTIKSYIQAYPDDFDTQKIDEAKRKGREFWERMGVQLAAGNIKAHPSAWIFNMKNRYGWGDKLDITTGGQKLLPEPLLTAKALKAMFKMMMLANKGIADADIVGEEEEEPEELPSQTL